MRLNGKTALITGAGSGIGKETAILFAEHGANVIAVDINGDAINSVVEDIKNNNREALGMIVDVSIQADIDRMIETAVDTYGELDILVNNAGVMDNFITVSDITDELWERILTINLTGAMRAARAAIDVMLKKDNGGVIINNTSVAGLYGARGGGSYSVSKHGLIGLTKNIAATYGTFHNIRCNAIAPGSIDTNIASTITEPSELGQKAVFNTGDVPTGEALDIANAALFLASDDSKFVNGTVITVDGGWTAR